LARKIITDRDLMDLFGFTSEDLEVNRQGYLTKTQRQHLQAKAKNLQFGIALLIAGYIVFVLIIFYNLLLPYTSTANLLAIMIGTGLVYLFLNLNFIFRIRKIKADIEENIVFSAIGHVILSYSSGGKHGQPEYKFYSRPKILEMSPQLVNTLPLGQNYRVYYALHSEVVVSIESFSGESEISKIDQDSEVISQQFIVLQESAQSTIYLTDDGEIMEKHNIQSKKV
jgi:hypothetical protein